MLETSSDVMRRWFHEVWTKSRSDVIYELFPPEGKAYGLGDPITGPDEFKTLWDFMHSSFGSIELEVVSSMDDGERCWVRCEGTLNYRGRSVDLKGGCECVVVDERILTAHNYWDFIGTMSQMNALPSDAFLRACSGDRLSWQT